MKITTYPLAANTDFKCLLVHGDKKKNMEWQSDIFKGPKVERFALTSYYSSVKTLCLQLFKFAIPC